MARSGICRRVLAGFAAALTCSAAHAAEPNATVVEYYRAAVDHYFITASPTEQAVLDAGTIPGWRRTGVTFAAWSDAPSAPKDAVPVCRFYGRPEFGLDSHFYSASATECSSLAARVPAAWQLEAYDVFLIQTPDASGTCAEGTLPISRLYDNRSDSNHRYAISRATRAAMQARDWVPEGAGPDAAVMCTRSVALQDVPYVDKTFYSVTAGGSLASGDEAGAITRHVIVLDGKPLRYTATAGHLSPRDAKAGTPQASMFYVAYTADDADPVTRPVTFFFNGGPGSATVWLHLGSFGPKRLVTGEPATNAPQPFPLVDNAETLLDTSDLVFIDAVGAGLSQAIAPFSNQSFWSVDRDALVFRDFIERYVDLNGRRHSPKFLFGESYGTTRAAVLANALEMAGVDLDGVVLQSAVLDYGANCGVIEDSDIPCTGYLPTYGLIGAYYQLVHPPIVDTNPFRDAIEDFALTRYQPALAPWFTTKSLPPADLITALSNRTGIAAALWRARFNLDPARFQVNLLPHVLIGRYDARVSAPSGSALAQGGDPSAALISPSFQSAIGGYLRDSLKYTFASPYVLLSDASDQWDYSHDGRELPDAVPDLMAALQQNPRMRVLSLNGYHDLATPYFQTRLDLDRLGPNAPVLFRAYDGGHMTYLDDIARPRQRDELRALYANGTAKKAAR